MGSSEMDFLSVAAQPAGPRSRLYSSDSRNGAEQERLVTTLVSTNLEHLSRLNIISSPHIVRNTGIVCTIGGFLAGLRWARVCACVCG